MLEWATFLHENGRDEAALQLVERAATMNPSSIRPQFVRLQVLLSLSRYNDAMSTIEKIIGSIGEQEYLRRLKLDIAYNMGKFPEIIELLQGEFARGDLVQAGRGEEENNFFWKGLILARALWAENKQEEALRVYDVLLTPSVDSLFREKIEAEKITLSVSPSEDDFWNMVTFKNSEDSSPLASYFEPAFVAGNVGESVDRIASDFYGAYRWQELIKKERAARDAIRTRDYYQAEKKYLALLKETKSPENILDLAFVYDKLGLEREMVQRIPMSKAGIAKLKAELQQLERVERSAVVKAIEVAREHGDLKENAEYHAAKERLGHIEGRILELKDKINRAEVIDCAKVPCDKAVFGTVVTLLDMENDEELAYQLLGPEEADVKQGSISVLSPLGRSMLGKEVGEEVVVQTPGGTREFEVISISPSTFS
ncbi:unnamed protein product [Cyprideis torosa]|uniref:Transcription elongation factor GreA n=1 Tax=Cyprideis torosa TaxID=163714 RepID=A0A7R8WR71_9CRUS|nr:unnamed protein product [Cyprideis torosa]CAG0903507.1 unnamed protein product [Cyprideis torosa]